MRTRSAIYLFILCCFFSFSSAQGYMWPLWPVSERYCRGTFCEYRSGNPNHFHEGIDIPAYSSGYYVYATTDTFQYIGRESTSYGWIVTVQHYTQSGSSQWPLDEGSRYIHMNDVEPLSQWAVYIGQPLAINITFHDNHLHFEMRWPAPVGVVGLENIFNAYNPFIEEVLCPPNDGYKPDLDYFYVDGSTQHQGDATIENWNFLGYDFSYYYNGYISSPFIRLTLPEQDTRDNDLDDPHILIGDNCKVRFILKAKDEITNGYPNCAPYWISLYLDADLAHGDGNNPVIDDAEPFYEVKFDDLENEFGQNETYDEEDVYHTESPLVSDQSTFYYRLYPNDSDLPGCILSGSSTVLETENMEEGQHRIRVVVEDYRGNIKTADAHFYKRTEDWVDYCRAFFDN